MRLMDSRNQYLKKNSACFCKLSHCVWLTRIKKFSRFLIVSTFTLFHWGFYTCLSLVPIPSHCTLWTSTTAGTFGRPKGELMFLIFFLLRALELFCFLFSLFVFSYSHAYCSSPLLELFLLSCAFFELNFFITEMPRQASNKAVAQLQQSTKVQRELVTGVWDRLAPRLLQGGDREGYSPPLAQKIGYRGEG